MTYRICLPLNGFLRLACTSEENLPVRLATRRKSQRKSLRKSNLPLLATICESVWPGLYWEMYTLGEDSLFIWIFPLRFWPCFKWILRWKFQQTEEKNNYRERAHMYSFLDFFFSFLILFSITCLSWSWMSNYYKYAHLHVLIIPTWHFPCKTRSIWIAFQPVSRNIGPVRLPVNNAQVYINF